MDNPFLIPVLQSLAVLVVTAVIGFFAGRRWGIMALWVVLAAVAVLGIWGWNAYQQPAYGEAMRSRHILLYFLITPGITALIVGLAAGIWAHLSRRG